VIPVASQSRGYSESVRQRAGATLDGILDPRFLILDAAGTARNAEFPTANIEPGGETLDFEPLAFVCVFGGGIFRCGGAALGQLAIAKSIRV